MGHSLRIVVHSVAALALLCSVSSAGAATLTVGATNECSGACDHETIQAAVNAASSGDTITIYKKASGYFDEFVLIPGTLDNLTIDGGGKCAGAADASCAAILAPSTSAAASNALAMIECYGDNLTIQDLHISGKINGNNAYGTGGRSYGSGVATFGEDLTMNHVSVDFTASYNVAYRSTSGVGTFRNCAFHHSDWAQPNVFIWKAPGSSGSPHIIENCLIYSGQGIKVGSTVNYVRIAHNIISGFAYWSYLSASSSISYDGSGHSTKSNARGWRYVSSCQGIVLGNSHAGLEVYNNLIVGTRNGIQVKTNATIRSNTIVNCFNVVDDSSDGNFQVSEICDNTYGIKVETGFSGTIENNIVYVNPGVAYPADADSLTVSGTDGGKLFSPGICGTGIGGSGTISLSSPQINNNNVYGFVDSSGGVKNYGNYDDGGTTKTLDQSGTANEDIDPGFAADSTPEHGTSLVDASRQYNVEWDDYFLQSQRGGSCHAEAIANSIGEPVYIPANTTYDIAFLGDCSYATDSGNSLLIDWGTNWTKSGSSAYTYEPSDNGLFPNLGAFGATDRAAKSPTLRITKINIGAGSVKNGTNDYHGPGAVMPRSAGIKTIDIYFNRQVNYQSGFGNTFTLMDSCGTQLSEPSGFAITNNTSSQPFYVRLSWTNGYLEKAVRVHVEGDTGDANKLYAVSGTETMDGDISNIESGTVPSGDNTIGGDGEFIVFAKLGDVNGDRDVDAADLTEITNADGSNAAIPEDIDGDGTVEGQTSEQDYLAASPYKADWWVTSTADTNTAGTLRNALTNLTASDVVKFDYYTFQPCSSGSGRITMGSAHPDVDDNNTTIDGSDAGVEIYGNAGAWQALKLTGSGITIKGLDMHYFASGVLWDTGAGNTIGGSGPREGNAIYHGVYGYVHQGSSGTANLKGNYIGRDRYNATTDKGHTAFGVYLIGAGGINIGGSGNNEGNLIVWNDTTTGAGGAGIAVAAGTPVIQGNYIGVDGSGNNLPNYAGILVDSTMTGTMTIGGDNTANEHNIIGMNYGSIDLRHDTGATVNVYGNYIGTDTTGTQDYGGTFDWTGISLRNGGTTYVGDGTAAHSNIIANKTHASFGVGIYSLPNLYDGSLHVRKNTIKNNKFGIQLNLNTDNAIIGSTDPATDNSYQCTLQNSTAYNIIVAGATSDYNRWRGNIIYGATNKEVFLNADGNDNVARPDIDSTSKTGSTWTIAGSNCSASAKVDLYKTDSSTSEAKSYIGSTTANGSGDWTIDLADSVVDTGDYVVAIQTDSNNNSSELSTPATSL